METLPWELLLKILQEVPSRYIPFAELVSKSWRDIIILNIRRWTNPINYSELIFCRDHHLLSWLWRTEMRGTIDIVNKIHEMYWRNCAQLDTPPCTESKYAWFMGDEICAVGIMRDDPNICRAFINDIATERNALNLALVYESINVIYEFKRSKINLSGFDMVLINNWKNKDNVSYMLFYMND